ncbi:MAG: hypothetical protein R3B13_20470 [Polyangiaceae bacterium]
MSRQVQLLGVLSLALLACKLLEPSPEKVCAKSEKLGLDSDATTCVSKLSKLKKEQPEKYKCASKCVNDSSDKEAANTCLTACASLPEATASNDGARVDTLTTGTIKAYALAEHQQMKLLSEKTNSAGWTITTGAPATEHLDAYVYKVIYVDIESNSEGYETMKSFESSAEGNVSYEVGERKALYIECWRVGSRTSKTNCSASLLRDKILKSSP